MAIIDTIVEYKTGHDQYMYLKALQQLMNKVEPVCEILKGHLLNATNCGMDAAIISALTDLHTKNNALLDKINTYSTFLRQIDDPDHVEPVGE